LDDNRTKRIHTTVMDAARERWEVEVASLHVWE